MWLWIALWYLNVSCIRCFSELREFPNPQKQPHLCGRPKVSYICDPEFILDIREADKLDQLAKDLKRSTSCICNDCPENHGIQIGILIKNNSIEKDSLDNRGKELAENIRCNWKLGTCEDDIIIILFIQSNIINFSLGSSVQRFLSEEKASHVLTGCQIHFDSGYYYQGLESIVNSFNDIINQEQKDGSESYRNLWIYLLIGFGILLIIACFGLARYLRQVKRRKQSCSNIYENETKKATRGNLENDLEQLEKLNKKYNEEIEDV